MGEESSSCLGLLWFGVIGNGAGGGRVRGWSNRRDDGRLEFFWEVKELEKCSGGHG